MIKKIRSQLVWWYALIMALVLAVCFTLGYWAYRYSSITLMEDWLGDYLAEEVREAEDFLQQEREKPEIHQNTSGVQSFHNLDYWFADKQLVQAETPSDSAVAAELLNKFLTQDFRDAENYHLKIGKGAHRWHFMMQKQSWQLKNGKTATVFVLANYTPIRHTMRMFVKIAAVAVLVLALLAYLLGSLLAARSMTYIEVWLQKQKQFVADAAHELRTPLAVLLSNTELLEYQPNDKQIICGIKEEILQMNRLIDSLLFAARYDNGVLPVNLERVVLNELLRSAVRAMSGVCPKGSIRLYLPKEEVAVFADKGMLRQLMYILLDNAVKYTPENKEIEVRLSVFGKTAEIKVVDNGCGIAPEDLPHIFERFWRADAARHHKGLGLGLCLAEMIAVRHNGSIKAVSEPEKGTAFTVCLPLV